MGKPTRDFVDFDWVADGWSCTAGEAESIAAEWGFAAIEKDGARGLSGGDYVTAVRRWNEERNRKHSDRDKRREAAREKSRSWKAARAKYDRRLADALATGFHDTESIAKNLFGSAERWMRVFANATRLGIELVAIEPDGAAPDQPPKSQRFGLYADGLEAYRAARLRDEQERKAAEDRQSREATDKADRMRREIEEEKGRRRRQRAEWNRRVNEARADLEAAREVREDLEDAPSRRRSDLAAIDWAWRVGSRKAARARRDGLDAAFAAYRDAAQAAGSDRPDLLSAYDEKRALLEAEHDDATRAINRERTERRRQCNAEWDDRVRTLVAKRPSRARLNWLQERYRAACVDGPEPPFVPTTEPGGDRAALVREAVRHWTGRRTKRGAPRMRDLRRHLGFHVTPAERDAAVEQHRGEAAL